MADTKRVNTELNPTKTIQVRVVNFSNGLRVFEEVQMVRIKSGNYTLLVMADHIPVIGEINGNIEIVMKDEIKEFENVEAFYMERANVLSILLKD